MIVFDSKYFRELKFTAQQTERYLEAAHRAFRIASQSGEAEVQFQ